MSNYPFRFPAITIDAETAYLTGICQSRIEALLSIPILPSEQDSLSRVALIKGAQATTAIEGNTLTEADIAAILEGIQMPISQQYHEQEIKNTINAMQRIFDATITADSIPPIGVNQIKEFHRLIGQELGEAFAAIPGQFRNHNVTVGPYRPPDHEEIPILMGNYCQWLQDTFKYGSPQYTMAAALQQAIAAHVVFEWIHPFGDGNGRTGRLIEFYILARAGVPDIACHLLSNHYNQTRNEYYRLLNECRIANNLGKFLKYALQGYADGLTSQLDSVADYLKHLAWREHVMNSFENHPSGQRDVINRKQELAKALPLGKAVNLFDYLASNKPDLAKIYYKLDERTIARDLQTLLELGLIEVLGNGTIRAKSEKLDIRYVPNRYAKKKSDK